MKSPSSEWLRVLILLVFFVFGRCSRCELFPSGALTMQGTVADRLLPGDIILYDFRLAFNISNNIVSLQMDFTGEALQFSTNTSADDVTWELTSARNVMYGRNSTEIVFFESMTNRDNYRVDFFNLSSQTWELKGTMSLTVAVQPVKLFCEPETAGAGDLVRTVVSVKEVHKDNSTCLWPIGSQYVYLNPPELWVVNETSAPVPMMSDYYALVKLALTDPQRSLTASRIEVRTPSEESSREVILTIQSAGISNVLGLTEASQTAAENVVSTGHSTYESFQNDVGILKLPALERDVINFSRAEVELRFGARAEDYSQLRDGNVVDIGSLVQFGAGGVAIYARGVASGLVGGTGSTETEAYDANGGALIWVSSVSVTLECPPPEQKRPLLVLALTESASCAYDGDARSGVDVALTHAPNSTATAYNITVRVYLSDVMHVLAHTNSVLRQNSLSVTQNGNIVTVDIARMTFSDPTTIMLNLALNLTEPLELLPEYHVITADASFTDRWGNDTSMFTDMEYVKIHLDKQCSSHVSWRAPGNCTCSHDDTRSDCACCVTGACQCGEVNPAQCVPCQLIEYCQPFLPGFDALTELKLSDGISSFICDPFHRYRPWSPGISCYKKYQRPDNTWGWTAINALVGAILALDVSTGNLYGVSNNGMARMRSVDGGLTWHALRPQDYEQAISTADLVSATVIDTGIEF